MLKIGKSLYNIIKAIKENKKAKEIKDLCLMNLLEYGTKQFFEAECSGNYIYGKKWDKALLLLAEYFCQDDSKINFIPLSSRIHIEHILPQTTDSSNSIWNILFTAEQRESLTNSIGNLTLLSMRKNIQAQNYSFAEKKIAYQDKDNMITSFVLTQNKLKYDQWTPDEVSKQAKYIQSIIDKIIRNVL